MSKFSKQTRFYISNGQYIYKLCAIFYYMREMEVLTTFEESEKAIGFH